MLSSIPSKPMMHFPPISDFPLFQNIFQSLKNFPSWPIFQKYFCLYPPKFWMTFSSRIHEIFHFPPYFRRIHTLPSISGKTLFPFFTFPPTFIQFTCFWSNLRVFSSPYFDHDAFMHYALQVLDAHASMSRKNHKIKSKRPDLIDSYFK